MVKNGFCVLVVDDSMLVVERILGDLRELDCIESLISALDFEEARQLLSENEVDITLLDIHMPGKSGIELLSHIKQNHPRVKNIMLTNQSDDYYRNICARIGADFFLDKTSEFEKVPELIEACFKSSSYGN
jgi:DNA-binding NarL/FixJ family response regulator